MLLVLLIAATLASSVNIQQVKAQPRTWIVDDNGPADYSKIQDAINAAQNGDTVFVHSGTYFEHVIINKALTLIGEEKNSTIIDGSLNGTTVKVEVNSVRISKFTLRRGYEGVSVQHSNGVTISDNHITLNNFEGLSIADSENSVIANNLIDFNNWDGAFISNTKNVTVRNNVASSNKISGIYAEESRDNNIDYNTLSNNTYYGIYVENVSSFSVVGNSISLNQFTGIYVLNLTSGVFHHNNFVNNSQQIFIDDESSNAWDNGVEGNFWSDYHGSDLFSGPGQSVSGSDGLGDSPYAIDTNNRDNYPLMDVITFFDAGTFDGVPYLVNVVSNSAISSFHLNATEKEVSFNVTIETDLGFCRVTIPRIIVEALWSEGYRVSIDGEIVSLSKWENDAYTYNYFIFNKLSHEVVFEAVDITAPTITILSPENKTYPSKSINVTFNLSEPASWMGYSLDSQINVTISGNTTVSSLSDGRHWIIIFANDTSGNMVRSDTVYFSIDTVAPSIEVLSPENKTYATSSISLSFDVSEPTSWMGFSLDGQANETVLTADTMISSLSDGSHSLIVYAKDAAGNIGVSQEISFTVNAQTSQGLLGIPFSIWIAAAVVAIVVVVAALALYFTKMRKKAPQVK
jgi:parallel beta-helix repeat protein